MFLLQTIKCGQVLECTKTPLSPSEHATVFIQIINKLKTSAQARQKLLHGIEFPLELTTSDVMEGLMCVSYQLDQDDLKGLCGVFKENREITFVGQWAERDMDRVLAGVKRVYRAIKEAAFEDGLDGCGRVHRLA